jgi:hypothetical protein
MAGRESVASSRWYHSFVDGQSLFSQHFGLRELLAFSESFCSYLAFVLFAGASRSRKSLRVKGEGSQAPVDGFFGWRNAFALKKERRVSFASEGEGNRGAKEAAW